MDIQIDLSGFGAPVVQNHTSKNIRLLRRYLHVADVDLEQEKCDKSQKVWLMAMWRICGVPFKHNHNISKMKLSSLSESLPKKHENRLSLARPPTLAERLSHKWSWCIHREDHSELVHGLSVPPQGGCETSLEGFMALTAALSMVHPGSKLAVRNRLQGPEAGQSYQRAQVIAQLSVQWKRMAEICPASFPHLFRFKNRIPTMPIFFTYISLTVPMLKSSWITVRTTQLVLVAMDWITANTRSIQTIFQLLTHLFAVAEDHGTVFSTTLLRDVLGDFSKGTVFHIFVNT